MALTLLAAMDLGPLEGDADDRAVVEEALALIDALAAAESSSSASSSGSVGSLRLGTSEGPRKKRRRNAAVDVARRRRKKQERVALRNEARGLEERLELMKARASIRIDLSPRNSTLQPEPTQSQVSEWRDRAVAQAQKAAAAIDLNQQLRSALNQQRPLIDVIQSATTANPQPAQVKICLQSNTTASIHALIFVLQMNVNHWDSTADRFNRSPEDSSIMKTLKNSIKQLYGRIDDELAPISFTPGIFSSNLAVKVDPVSGPYSEHTTAALVPHELNVVVKMIEEGMLQVSPPCIDLSFHIKVNSLALKSARYTGNSFDFRTDLYDRCLQRHRKGVQN